MLHSLNTHASFRAEGDYRAANTHRPRVVGGGGQAAFHRRKTDQYSYIAKTADNKSCTCVCIFIAFAIGCPYLSVCSCRPYPPRPPTPLCTCHLHPTNLTKKKMALSCGSVRCPPLNDVHHTHDSTSPHLKSQKNKQLTMHTRVSETCLRRGGQTKRKTPHPDNVRHSKD